MLQAAQNLGLPLQERRLNYYIHRGLLPKAVKRPHDGADGRAGYWPTSVLKRLRRLFQLKEQGYKLEQIRSALQGSRTLRHEPEGEEGDWRREVAVRFLKNSVVGDFPAARLELPPPGAALSEAEWVEALRHYQTRCLASLIGAEAAQHWVKQLFLEVHPRELRRWVTRFREQLGNAQEVPQEAFTSISRHLRAAASNHRLGRIWDDDFSGYLAGLRVAFEESARELDSLRSPTHACVQQALASALAALELLEPPAAAVREGLASFSLAVEQLRLCYDFEQRWSRLARASEVNG